MAFMERQVVHGDWLRVETDNGTEFIPADLADKDDWDDIAQYIEGDVESIEDVEGVTGWGARMTAPGYLDCTPWSVFDTKQEAEDYLTEQYGDEDDE